MSVADIYILYIYTHTLIVHKYLIYKLNYIVGLGHLVHIIFIIKIRLFGAIKLTISQNQAYLHRLQNYF